MSSFAQQAEKLLATGWRQCSTFYPNDKIGGDRGLPEGAVLVVVTQSCSVVGPNLARDPYLELAVATPFAGKFKATAHEARGRNIKTFRVCLDRDGTAVPYDIDINSRFTVPREEFLHFAPDGPACSATDATRVANWVARYYNRTALPSRMVDRMSASGFQKAVNSVFETPFEDGALHDEINSVYGQWEPDDETGPYRFLLTVIVESTEAADKLQEVLQNTFGDRDIPVRIGDVEDVEIFIDVQNYDEVTLAQLHGLSRISEWDLLSGLLAQA